MLPPQIHVFVPGPTNEGFPIPTAQRLRTEFWWALVDDLRTAELEVKQLPALFMNGGPMG